MLGLFIKKELIDGLLNMRFMALAVFSIVLMPLSAFINYEYFQERYGSFESQYNAYQQEEVRSWNMRAYRPPELLSAVARGTEAYMPLYFRLSDDQDPLKPGNIEAQDFSTLSTFGTLDFLFLVQIVFSLLAVLLAFDMIAGEKERGTLKAVLANRVPRDSVLLGKLIGGFLMLWLVFLIGFLLMTLVLLVQDPRFGDGVYLNRLLLMFGLSSLFLASFYSVGLMVSAFCHSTRTAIVALLVLWVVLQLVIPKTGEMLAAVAVSAPSQESVRIDKASVADDLDEELQTRAGDLFKRLTGWGEMRGPGGLTAFELLGSDAPEAVQFRDEYRALKNDYQQQIRDQLREIDQTYERAKARQQAVSQRIALLSPAAALTFLVTDLAGTGDETYRSYREAVSNHYEIIDRDLFSQQRANRYQVRIGGGSFSSSFPSSDDDDDAPEASDMPVFQSETPSIKAVLSVHAWAIGTLLVYLVVPFLVAYVAFLRYDVR
ncbi:MAG: DUF3526 domain-containing protein [Rhodothermales bacterium]